MYMSLCQGMAIIPCGGPSSLVAPLYKHIHAESVSSDTIEKLKSVGILHYSKKTDLRYSIK